MTGITTEMVHFNEIKTFKQKIPQQNPLMKKNGDTKKVFNFGTAQPKAQGNFNKSCINFNLNYYTDSFHSGNLQ